LASKPLRAMDTRTSISVVMLFTAVSNLEGRHPGRGNPAPGQDH
jgi:hypothetical protein